MTTIWQRKTALTASRRATNMPFIPWRSDLSFSHDFRWCSLYVRCTASFFAPIPMMQGALYPTSPEKPHKSVCSGVFVVLICDIIWAHFGGPRAPTTVCRQVYTACCKCSVLDCLQYECTHACVCACTIQGSTFTRDEDSRRSYPSCVEVNERAKTPADLAKDDA